MAGIKDTALSSQHSAVSRGKKQKPQPTKPKILAAHRRRRNVVRFHEASGKTVKFIEMDWSAEFPSIEVEFIDRTAMLFELGTRITMEPMYSDWTHRQPARARKLAAAANRRALTPRNARDNRVEQGFSPALDKVNAGLQPLGG